MGELLQMNTLFCNKPSKRKCLFPGRSCYPLSPDHQSDSRWNINHQLNQIIKKMGSPALEEIEKIENNEIKKAFMKLPPVAPCPLNNFFPAFPSDSMACIKYMKGKGIVDTINLFLWLLKFDAEKRVTAKVALKHKYFSRVKIQKVERKHKPVHFGFEDLSLDKDQLRERILKVVNQYNDKK